MTELVHQVHRDAVGVPVDEVTDLVDALKPDRCPLRDRLGSPI
ncbi:hypothetical protein [Saccharothrix sp. ALI-22-I]|nr:hypothetical protein [Saccharothrix sp. ALI-22-I]